VHEACEVYLAGRLHRGAVWYVESDRDKGQVYLRSHLGAMKGG
jgi:hypothetical protein